MVRETHPVARRRALRTIAVFEAVKGVAALAAALGLLRLLHHDLHRLAVDLIGHLGLDPADHYPSMMLQYADLLASTNVFTVVLLVTGYVLLRGFEAYGLWHERAWGEWLGALSGSLYIPFELHHVIHEAHPIGAAVLGLNVLVVAFLAYQLWRGTGMGRS
jgi:uncharacterized membrane protein (DUF2068 family)